MIVSLGSILLVGLIACATVGPREAEAATAPTMSWRFIGLEALKGKTNLVVFHQVTGLAEFEGFRSNLTERIAQRFAKQAAVGGANESELLGLFRPIAADLVSFQTVFEQHREGTNDICLLAIQLPAARHDIWKKNWDPIQKVVKVPGGRLTREGEWTVVSNGSTKEALDRARTPAKDVLELEGDSSFLGDILPWPGNAKMNLRVHEQGNGLRTEGKLKFEKDLALKLEKWEIPTNTIREPLAGFTAAQGMGPFLAKLPGFSKHKTPNQVFWWSEVVAPFTTYAAAKIDDPKKFVRDLAEELPKSELAKGLQGRLQLNTNTHTLVLLGLPISVPFARPAHSNDVNFVAAGLMPFSEYGGTPMPADLARAVTSRTNLVYFDWEIIALRGQLWRPAFQTMAFAKNQPPGLYNSAADKWLFEAEKKIGECVTEVTETGPRELTIARKSDLGLSSFELCKLTEWAGGSAAQPAITPAPALPAASTPTPAPAPAKQ
jgi:hypothetical protein